MLGVELRVEVHVVLGDLDEVLLEDLSLGGGLGEVVAEDMVGVLQSGDGVGLGVQTHSHVVELAPRAVKLHVKVRDSSVESVGLVYQSNVSLFNLAHMSLGGGEGALKISTIRSCCIQMVGQISHGSIKVGDLIS